MTSSGTSERTVSSAARAARNGGWSAVVSDRVPATVPVARRIQRDSSDTVLDELRVRVERRVDAVPESLLGADRLTPSALDRARGVDLVGGAPHDDDRARQAFAKLRAQGRRR